MTRYNAFTVVFLTTTSLAILMAILFLPGIVMKVFAWTGIREELAYRLTELLIGIILLVFSSDRFYSTIRTCCNNKLNQSGNKPVKLLLFIKVINDLIAAFPKRTLIFGIYLVLVIAQYFGLIKDIYNFGFIVIFLMAADKMVSSWKMEKENYTTHCEKAYRRANSIKSKETVKNCSSQR